MRFELRGRGGGENLSVPRAGDRFGSYYDPEGFGRFSERIAHTIGTAKFLVIQTVAVIVWVSWNMVAPDGWQFDAFPFILLNLAFSTQAAYAAPLILLAETRQADRDRSEASEDRRRSAEVKADLDYLARELASLRIRVADSADIARIESKLDRLLAHMDDRDPGS
ncbi:MAG: DUF1003 domain-containing protein [Microthrixaceae bacterium]|nr:DUF1003 domain-containing protein [Acidimicrobiales bacterium]MCB9403561.1 DUF1003 domain-containing protein [Microthrixaceae bacterium]